MARATAAETAVVFWCVVHTVSYVLFSLHHHPVCYSNTPSHAYSRTQAPSLLYMRCQAAAVAPTLFGNWNFRSHVLLLPGGKMAWNFRSACPTIIKTAHTVSRDHKTSFPVHDLLKLVGLHV